MSSSDLMTHERLDRPIMKVFQRHPGTQVPEAQEIIKVKPSSQRDASSCERLLASQPFWGCCSVVLALPLNYSFAGHWRVLGFPHSNQQEHQLVALSGLQPPRRYSRQITRLWSWCSRVTQSPTESRSSVDHGEASLIPTLSPCSVCYWV